MLIRIIKNEIELHNWILLLVDIDTKVNSNKTFWDAKPEILKRKLWKSLNKKFQS